MTQKQVTLITGFLGAGKTTLLNYIIAERKNTRFAIIENEIGEESIDAELVLRGDDDIIEFNNGCLCCSLNDNLYDVLTSLLARENEWDELLIEATGVADPANIALPFLTNPQVQRYFRLAKVICLVDAELAEDQLRDTEEAIKQIAFSDIILLNKTESVSPHYVKELEGIIIQINPFAKVIAGRKNNFHIDIITAHQRLEDFPLNPPVIATPKGIISLGKLITADTSMLSANSHKKHQHSEIETILLKYTGEFDLLKLEHQLRVFLMVQSVNVYRIKGIINSNNYDHKVILQSVGKGLSITLGSAWKAEEAKASKIVIIGKQLKIQGFDKLFSSCLDVTVS